MRISKILFLYKCISISSDKPEPDTERLIVRAVVVIYSFVLFDAEYTLHADTLGIRISMTASNKWHLSPSDGLNEASYELLALSLQATRDRRILFSQMTDKKKSWYIKP